MLGSKKIKFVIHHIHHHSRSHSRSSSIDLHNIQIRISIRISTFTLPFRPVYHACSSCYFNPVKSRMRSILYPLWILFISVASIKQIQPNNFRAEYIAPCCATVAGDTISLLNCSLHASSANTELLKSHPKTFRLAVTMYATVDISVYSAYSFAINEAYCEYYGCAFIYQDSREV